MKKFVVLLLVLLPIFLIITISFAGRIFSIYNYIYVERVAFINELEEELEEGFIFKLNKGQEKETMLKIFPELSTNKDVKYVSQNQKVATINEKGVVFGVGFGSTMITVTTVDSQKVSTLLVSVTDDNVAGVEIVGDKTISLGLGQIHKLEVEINPETAINKNVTWTSSNSSVATVSINGNVNAHSLGETIITATTRDGAFTDSVTIIVKEANFEFTLDTTGNAKVAVVYQKELMLKDYIKITNAEIKIEDIKFEIRDGTNDAIVTVDENSGHLTFIQSNTIITLDAYVGNKANPIHKIEIKLLWSLG